MAQASDGPSSWASHAAVGSFQKLSKNVMEIYLEKDVKGGFDASDSKTARVLQKLGVDISSHVDMVQICPLGKNVIQVTLKDNINIDRFVNKEAFEVKAGVRVSNVRAAGQREVTLLIKGLHPQTPDSRVFEYLKCMGKIHKTKVILDTYQDGPLKGLQNGDRRYFVEFYPNISIGALHVVDGQKVTFSYPGQKRSCFRCLNIAHSCPGNGIARACEAAGGSRKLLSVHMQEFWSLIKYTPQVLPSSDQVTEDIDEIQLQIGGSFTPKVKPAQAHTKNDSNSKRCTAVSVKWFPKRADHGEIREFLVKYGLPENHSCVNIKDNGQVVISDLDPDICDLLCDKITGSKFKDKKTIYCQGIVLATPQKSSGSAQNQEGAQSLPPAAVSPLGKHNSPTSHSNDEEYVFNDLQQTNFFRKPSKSESDDSDQYLVDEDDKWTLNSNKRKKKKMLTGKVAIKKVNNKATPE